MICIFVFVRSNYKRSVTDSETGDVHNAINTNLIAPTILAREAIQSMRRRYARGHIINISG